MLRIFSPHSLMTKKLSADFQRGEGRGTRDGKNGRAKFLPSRKRQRLATGDWRLQRQKLLSAENFSAVQKLCPPEKPFATRYSPFATRRSLLATRYSPFAIRYSLPFPIALLRFSASPLLPFTLPLLPTFTPSPLLPSLPSASPP
jgi:hypothetical protein